jgi:cytochrome b561
VINNVIEKNNDPFFITIDILNHGVLFVLTLALFVVGLFSRVRKGSSNFFGKTLNYSEMF